jgi:hypothetical protein
MKLLFSKSLRSFFFSPIFLYCSLSFQSGIEHLLILILGWVKSIKLNKIYERYN